MTLNPPSQNTVSASRDEGSHQAWKNSPHLVRIPEAARITGLPSSLLRKSFMRENKRPRNVPPPPPHRRIGRAIYILADQLAAWIQSLDRQPAAAVGNISRGRGRPTVAQRISPREQQAT